MFLVLVFVLHPIYAEGSNLTTERSCGLIRVGSSRSERLFSTCDIIQNKDPSVNFRKRNPKGGRPKLHLGNSLISEILRKMRQL